MYRKRLHWRDCVNITYFYFWNIVNSQLIILCSVLSLKNWQKISFLKKSYSAAVQLKLLSSSKKLKRLLPLGVIKYLVLLYKLKKDMERWTKLNPSSLPGADFQVNALNYIFVFILVLVLAPLFVLIFSFASFYFLPALFLRSIKQILRVPFFDFLHRCYQIKLTGFD